MILADTYAAFLKNASSEGVADKVVARMKAKGHLSLLPQVLRILKRDQSVGRAVLTVAKKEDIKKYENNIEKVGGSLENMRTIVDPNIVSGFVVQNSGSLIDASGRRSLVNLYQKTVGHHG